MKIDTRLVRSSEQRLSFDPGDLVRSIAGKRPTDLAVENPPDRVALHRRYRAAMAKLDVNERQIADDDLVNVNTLEAGQIAARAVARLRILDRPGGNDLEYGTGFLISPTLLLTNNHVLPGPAQAANTLFEFNYQVDLHDIVGPVTTFKLASNGFLATDETLDYTLVALDPKPVEPNGRSLSDFGYLRMRDVTGKALVGQYLTIIQHPGAKTKKIANRNNQFLKIDDDQLRLWYYTDTSSGSSGSPVMNDFWEVVALHHQGVPKRDEQGRYILLNGQPAVGEPDESEIQWLANEGIRASRIIEHLKGFATRTPELEQFLLKAIVNTPAPVEAASPPPPSRNQRVTPLNPPKQPASTTTSKPKGATMPQSDLSSPIGYGKVFTANTGDSAKEALQVSEKITIDPDYSNRKGYDSGFLGSGYTVELPTLSTEIMNDHAADNNAANGGDPHVLPYTHFSIVMNGIRKLPFFTAVNIDGRLAVAIRRETDRWFKDPRVDSDQQTGEDLFAGNQLDRGHLVRRLDPAWGSTMDESLKANNDTFHFTNCSPQHEKFNQGKTLWAGLEDYILDNAKSESFKVNVFSGPVFRPDDQLYREKYYLPRQYWKVVTMVAKDRGRLSATAYLLSQASLLKTDLDEAFSFGEYRTFQVTVRKVSDLTGLDFGPLSSFDPLNAVEGLGVRQLNTVEEIRL